jgi:hypothetical protein
MLTFNFSESIRDGSFTIDDIGIVNGTIDSGSFTKVSETQYAIRVTSQLLISWLKTFALENALRVLFA